jgi:hypothetical protein
MKRAGHILMIPFALCAGALIVAWIALVASGAAKPAGDVTVDRELAFLPRPGSPLPPSARCPRNDGRSASIRTAYHRTKTVPERRKAASLEVTGGSDSNGGCSTFGICPPVSLADSA